MTNVMDRNVSCVRSLLVQPLLLLDHIFPAVRPNLLLGSFYQVSFGCTFLGLLVQGFFQYLVTMIFRCNHIFLHRWFKYASILQVLYFFLFKTYLRVIDPMWRGFYFCVTIVMKKIKANFNTCHVQMVISRSPVRRKGIAVLSQQEPNAQVPIIVVCRQPLN
jgi:hypothetical protein